MKLKNKTIFILSPEAWGTSFVSKHHYASLLASEGNQVFFINPPSSNFKKNQVKDHLTVIDYSLGSLRGINRLPSFLRDIFNGILIRKLIRFIGKKPDIIWSFDPFRFQNLQLFGANCKIYHPVDVHQTNLEVEAAKTADVIFSTANKILERFSSIKTAKYFINHGLASHFLENSAEIDFEVQKNSINVGYVGNLNYQYLDKEILAEILNENADVNFYFIGPYEKSNLSENINVAFIESIRKLPNVFLLGPKPSRELAAYLNKFDLLLMCYSGDRNVAQMANPHKILEYLSSGKVALTHFIDEYKNQPELFLMCNKNNELPEQFKYALKNLSLLNNKESMLRRIKFASENTYSKQLERIELILNQHCNSIFK
jgi:glycosyltransferase involved in cell wall biosynthesis